jgi:hypothetical protein
MEIKRALGITLLLLIAVCLVYAGQSHSQGTGPLGTTPSTAAPAQVQSYPQGPHAYGPGTQTPAYPSQAQPGMGTWNTDGTPNYPYPAYHNPYYDGTTARNAVTQTVEWVFGLPAMVMDGVSNFLDNSFFPRVPATQGGQPPADASGAPPAQATQPPSSLPQAGPYNPAPR